MFYFNFNSSINHRVLYEMLFINDNIANNNNNNIANNNNSNNNNKICIYAQKKCDQIKVVQRRLN